jgi:uncharacterized protein
MSGFAARIRAVVNPRSARVEEQSAFGGRQSAAAGPQSTVQPPAFGPQARSDLACLGGAWRDGVFVIERRYERQVRHGRDTVGGIADRLARGSICAQWFAGLSRENAEPTRAGAPFVFFDLETTGLNGGAGTQAFLVGCAAFDGDGAFVVRQFVLTAAADEKPLLGVVQSSLRQAGALVSFNGKAFDSPLLESRYLFHRLTWNAGRLPHIDVLHPARRFWGSPAPRSPYAGGSDCSLATLERHIVGARRPGDVPGFEIPARYFQFVRSGDARLLAPVLEHNRLDLLTLAALTSRLLHLANMGPEEASNAREALALGHVFARAGMEYQARDAFERSLALCAAPPGAYDATRIDALRALALAWRRARQFDRAAERWSELLQLRGCPAAIAREASEALAIHHEHRVRDLTAARVFALRGLDEQGTPAPTWTRAVRHRLARIDRKLSVSAPPSLLS